MARMATDMQSTSKHKRRGHRNPACTTVCGGCGVALCTNGGSGALTNLIDDNEVAGVREGRQYRRHGRQIVAVNDALLHVASTT